jgi:hypothetical protein
MSIVHDDLDGRLVILRNRLLPLSQAAQAHVSAYSAVGAISKDAIRGWARALEALAKETASVHVELVRQSEEQLMAAGR